jgi:electron transfer flavoprotein alpha/beta subunit
MGIKRAGAKPIEVLSAAAPGAAKTRLERLYVPEVGTAAQMFEGTIDEKAQRLAEVLKSKGVA